MPPDSLGSRSIVNDFQKDIQRDLSTFNQTTGGEGGRMGIWATEVNSWLAHIDILVGLTGGEKTMK